jgi:SAM-dependent methyltransferase
MPNSETHDRQLDTPMNAPASQTDFPSGPVFPDESSARQDDERQRNLDKCPACNGAAATVVQRIDLKVQHRSYTNDEALQRQLTVLANAPNDTVAMLKCDSCKLEYASPLHAPGAEWYGNVYSALDLYPTQRWEFAFVLNTISKQETLGELGCGSGEFLQLCRAAGLQASGVDFSQQAVDACIQFGLSAKLFDLDTETTDYPGTVAPDVIVAFQVLEHLEDPRALFRCAQQWASSKGRLWIAVPSDRRPSRFVREPDVLDEPPHHMTRWTESALNKIAAGTGWQYRRVIYEPIGIGTKIWWLSTRSAFYQRMRDAELLSNRLSERALRVALAPFAWMRALIHGASISGQTMLAEYSRSDERVEV